MSELEKQLKLFNHHFQSWVHKNRLKYLTGQFEAVIPFLESLIITQIEDEMYSFRLHFTVNNQSFELPCYGAMDEDITEFGSRYGVSYIGKATAVLDIVHCNDFGFLQWEEQMSRAKLEDILIRIDYKWDDQIILSATRINKHVISIELESGRKVNVEI